MARTSLYDVSAIPDPAQVWEFDLFLPAIPGSSDTRQLTWRTMTSALPGTEIDRVNVALHGVELVFMGRRNYSHTFNTSMLEAIDWRTRGQIKAWMDSGRNWITNTGSQSSTYKVNSQIVLYNDMPQVALTTTVFGMWPQALGDVSLDGGQSNHINQDITWSYDYVDDV